MISIDIDIMILWLVILWYQLNLLWYYWIYWHYWIYEDHWGPQPRCTTWPLETTATVSQLLNSDMSCHKVPKNDPLSDCGKTQSFYHFILFKWWFWDVFFYHLYTIYGNARLVLINAKLCVAIKVVGRDVRPKTASKVNQVETKKCYDICGWRVPNSSHFCFRKKRCKTTAGTRTGWWIIFSPLTKIMLLSIIIPFSWINW